MTNEIGDKDSFKNSSNFCIHCGSKMDYGSEECSKCDKKDKVKYCINCGSSMVHNAEYCSECGLKGGNISNVPVSNSKGLLNSTSSTLATIAVIAGFIIAFTIYFFFIIINNPPSQVIVSQLTLQTVIIILASLFGLCGIIISNIYYKIAAVQYIMCAIGLFFGGTLLLIIPIVLFVVAAFLEYKIGEEYNE
ncbi:MAG: zinc ribbon domain-containing protein [Methanobacteriaceae archaeon]|jgi:hypothetical protein|nr:zinc ribbon domain-containing protein [Methanobacteriaceae archaeon]